MGSLVSDTGIMPSGHATLQHRPFTWYVQIAAHTACTCTAGSWKRKHLHPHCFNLSSRRTSTSIVGGDVFAALERLLNLQLVLGASCSALHCCLARHAHARSVHTPSSRSAHSAENDCKSPPCADHTDRRNSRSVYQRQGIGPQRMRQAFGQLGLDQ